MSSPGSLQTVRFLFLSSGAEDGLFLNVFDKYWSSSSASSTGVIFSTFMWCTFESIGTDV